MKKMLFTWCVATAVAVCFLSTGFAAEKPAKGDKKPDFEAIFKKLDKDSSGDLTLAEFKGKREEEKAKKSFDRLDKDNSGKLTLKEFTTRPMRKKGDK